MTGACSWKGNLLARLRKTGRRMRAEGRKGSAAIEFALIAPVFFLLLMGIIENGLIFFASTTLQNATDNAARYVRTGQAQAANLTKDTFRQRICNDISALLSCDVAHLQVDLKSYPTGYTSATFQAPTDTSGNLDSSLSNYVPGTACNVVLLRVFYTWSVSTPFLSPFLTNMTAGKRLISATAAFRNEPFTSAVQGC